VFSRDGFVWEGIDRDHVAIITPTIDAFTPKNYELAPDTVLAILRASALVGDGTATEPVAFRRQDGTPGRVERRARLIEDVPLRAETPIVVQVSRWDALKDPVGVIRGFGEHVPAVTGCPSVPLWLALRPAIGGSCSRIGATPLARLLLAARETEIDVEVAAGRRNPREAPAHALLVRLQLVERRL
jgi:hypothetical protein